MELAEEGMQVAERTAGYLAQSFAAHVGVEGALGAGGSAVGRSLVRAVPGLEVGTAVVCFAQHFAGCRREGSACMRNSAEALDPGRAAAPDSRKFAADGPDADRLSKTVATRWAAWVRGPSETAA